MRRAPVSPTAKPAVTPREGARRRRYDATKVANSGFAPFSIPVNAEDTRCSAKGNILSGNANQSSPSQATDPQSARATGFLADGNNASVRKPTAIRKNATPLGPIERNPSAMKRKEAPQMRPGRTRSSQALVKLIHHAIPCMNARGAWRNLVAFSFKIRLP
jgi:hypothetical protein